jgi:5-methylcytosine-specific restriction endonuclease McrA
MKCHNPDCRKNFTPKLPSQNCCSRKCREHYKWLTDPKIKARQQAYRETHREQEKARVKRWELANPEKTKEKSRVKHQRNPDAMRIRNNRRYNREKNVLATLTTAEWKQILADWNYTCAYCGKGLNELQQEHFIPLSKGGVFAKGNIVPACPTCNRKKGAKDPLEWIAGLPNALVVYARIVLRLGKI